MPKRKIRVIISSSETNYSYETVSLYDNGIYQYREEDDTKTILNEKDLSLIRTNDELLLNYQFQEKEKTEGTLEIKELNQVVKLELLTEKITKTNNSIEIIYYIEDNKFIYRIEVIE